MKRFIFLITTLLLFSHSIILANEEQKNYDYTNLVLSLKESGEPVVTDDYIIFTSDVKYRFIGIAFDFENYKTIHPFQIRKTEDIDGNVTNNIMFYILDKMENKDGFLYRLVIDGLWTTDPMNPMKVYDPETGITCSKITMNVKETKHTEYKQDDSIHFVYDGEPGQQVRLAGNFTNWDSWIYEMEETRPGFYELNLHLPEGTYYYNYYIGMSSLHDKTNPEKVYTQDGRTISVITVQ